MTKPGPWKNKGENFKYRVVGARYATRSEIFIYNVKKAWFRAWPVGVLGFMFLMALFFWAQGWLEIIHENG